ncbi:MBL fold metallo-hydrolase [Fodinibacter luteus]|uniref:MBL fold metallo-hydrolase n=1 Tax=Fodinibacter luteus TaxID=552064 RepID=A0ABP8JXJ2_9MICO
MATIIPIETPSLGDRSYLVHDGATAFVVDPQRDIDRVLDLAEREGVRVAHVFETHIHNDYVTGGLALARAVGAVYHVNGDDDVAFERSPIADGDTVEVSEALRVRAIATPGHTFTHLSYAVEDAGRPVGVFTGGSLLFGATGRPDLLGPDHTHDLVRHQYASARRLADELPDDAQVLPTHGFGSFCSAGTTSGADASTIGTEKGANPALTQPEDAWVADVLAGLDAYPTYYAHMDPANSGGPSAPDLRAPEKADRAAVARALADGEWVVDLRTRTAFSAGHVPGTVNIGVDGQLSTYVGWLMPWGAPLTLLGESPEQVAEAQRELVRIGIDRLEGAASGEPGEWTDAALASVPRATFADLEQVRHHRPVGVLDVRQASEHAEAHLPGATNIPIGDLLERLDDVPAGEIWVHCASGYRAAIAASLLAANGGQVVLVDDDFDDHAGVA